MSQKIAINTCNRRVQKELADQETATSYELILKDDGNIHVGLVKFKVFAGPYKGQEHVMEVKFVWGHGSNTSYFPLSPPLLTFKTPILHPNIGSYPGGAVCLDFVKQSGLWAPACNLGGVVQMIKALLLDANPSSPQNSAAGKEYTKCMKANKKKKSEKKQSDDESEESNVGDKHWRQLCSDYYNKYIKSCSELMARFSKKKLTDDDMTKDNSDDADISEEDESSSLSMPSYSESEDSPSDSCEIPEPVVAKKPVKKPKSKLKTEKKKSTKKTDKKVKAKKSSKK